MSSSGGRPVARAIRPATPGDLQDVLRLRQEVELTESDTPNTTAERLSAEWEALGARLGEQIWVAEAANGASIACAELKPVDQVYTARLWVTANYRDGVVEQALLASMEEQAKADGLQANATSVTLFAQASASHPAAHGALARSGFVMTSAYEEMEFRLTESPRSFASVSGVEIRPFADGQDEAAVCRADEEAFLDQRGHTPRTYEQWQRRLNQSGAAPDPALWLIAWDGEEVAGAALGEVVGAIGWIHHLFVRRAWRRRGLGAALTRAVLTAFYQRGISAARLNVDAQSLTNAHTLYRRVGFQVIGGYSNFEKIVALT